MKRINIHLDFSNTPGPRLRNEGKFSGEEFREEVLIPKLQECSEDESLLVDLDGAEGYATSFLEESFGGLVRSGYQDLIHKLSFKSEEEEYLIDEINDFIKEAIDREKSS